MKLTILLLIIVLAKSSSKNWGLLVAGSWGYENYRHQSDVFHSYHVLINHGVPPENIILMAYDDIVNTDENPLQGRVFNHPDGEDVYKGVKIDYKYKSVNPKNFLAILSGDKDSVSGGNGRVIESTSEDNIFVFFDDHGSYQSIVFARGHLNAKDLNDALDNLYTKKKFNKLVFYIEACESGSMFDGLLKPGKNIYGVTASRPDESSHGIFCYDEARVNGTSLGTCLGDEFAVNWMEHSDVIDVWSTTVGQQKDFVTQKTKSNHVCEYGDLSIREELLGYFIGRKNAKWNNFVKYLHNNFSENYKNYHKYDSRLNRLYYLKYKFEKSGSQVDKDIYFNEIKMSLRSKNIFDLFSKKFNLGKRVKADLVDFNCYEELFSLYENTCGFDVDRDAKYVYYFSDFCSRSFKISEAYMFFRNIC